MMIVVILSVRNSCFPADPYFLGTARRELYIESNDASATPLSQLAIGGNEVIR
jgi:hypothetical protein